MLLPMEQVYLVCISLDSIVSDDWPHPNKQVYLKCINLGSIVSDDWQHPNKQERCHSFARIYFCQSFLYELDKLCFLLRKTNKAFNKRWKLVINQSWLTDLSPMQLFSVPPGGREKVLRVSCRGSVFSIFEISFTWKRQMEWI